MVRQYEYKILRASKGVPKRILDELGEDGWSIASVHWKWVGGESQPVAVILQRDLRTKGGSLVDDEDIDFHRD